jgi:ubiquinone biosynthesis protein COQ9
MLEKTEEAIKYGESRETDTIWYTKRGKHNAICVGHHYGQTITNNVNKTCALLQTIRVITKLPNSELKVKTNQIDSITHSWT